MTDSDSFFHKVDDAAYAMSLYRTTLKRENALLAENELLLRANTGANLRIVQLESGLLKIEAGAAPIGSPYDDGLTLAECAHIARVTLHPPGEKP